MVSVIVLMLGVLTIPALGVNGNNQVELEWMRSSEEVSYVVPVSQFGDAWNYSQAMANTPLQYFQTESTKDDAVGRVNNGDEWIHSGDHKVGLNYIWDRGNFFDKYREENGNANYYWTSWEHNGIDAVSDKSDGEYSVRRFSTYVDVSQNVYDNITSVLLAPTDELGNMSYLFPVNDTVYVFVNGQLAFWGGTDLIEGENTWGALFRNTFLGLPGVPVRNGVNGIFKNIYPHTDGWCIDLEISKEALNIKNLLNPGFNRIDIFADDYWEGGGMNKLNLFFDATPPANPPEIKKTINGQDIFEWASEYGYDVENVIASMRFEAENILTGDKHYGEINNTTGEIDFTPVLTSGEYKMVETFTGTSTLFAVKGTQNITIDGNMEAISTNRYISDATYGTVISAEAGENGQNWNLPDVWSSRLKGEPAFDKLVEMGAQWIWNTENTYQFGTNGGIFETKIDIYADKDTSVPFYLAVDNVAAVYVNAKLAFYTDVALDGRDLSENYSPDVFGELDFKNFDGRWDEGWAHAYEKELNLTEGHNEIIIIAANSAWAESGENNSYNETNNPCGVIFGFEVNSTTFNNRLKFIPPETPVNP